jgi:hypothetical protein
MDSIHEKSLLTEKKIRRKQSENCLALAISGRVKYGIEASSPPRRTK